MTGADDLPETDLMTPRIEAGKNPDGTGQDAK
jgi:hypothetical protein